MMRILTFLCWGLAVSLMAPVGTAASEEAPDPPSGPQGDLGPRDVPLREVLPQLTEQTGIQFQVPESLQDELIPWQNNGERDDASYSTGWVRGRALKRVKNLLGAAKSRSGNRRSQRGLIFSLNRTSVKPKCRWEY